MPRTTPPGRTDEARAEREPLGQVQGRPGDRNVERSEAGFGQDVLDSLEEDTRLGEWELAARRREEGALLLDGLDQGHRQVGPNQGEDGPRQASTATHIDHRLRVRSDVGADGQAVHEVALDDSLGVPDHGEVDALVPAQQEVEILAKGGFGSGGQ